MENEKKIEEKVQVLVAKKIPDLELPSVLEVRPRSKSDMLMYTQKRLHDTVLYFIAHTLHHTGNSPYMNGNVITTKRGKI